MEYKYQVPGIMNNKVSYKEEILHINEENLLKTLHIWGQALMMNAPIDVIEKIFQDNAKQINMFSYLENFYLKVGEALGIWMWNYKRTLDTKYGEYAPQDEAAREIFNLKYSQKRREETLQEFYNEILATIKQCRIKEDKLRDIYKAMIGAKTDEETDKRKKDFYQAIRKVYIALRKKWYAHMDLRQ